MANAQLATLAQQLQDLANAEPQATDRSYIHEPQTTGEKIADAVATTMGSWRFIIIQTIVVGCWITINIVAVAFRWDAYPFILLNLLFSTQAAYAAPVIMMSQNRQSQKDHVRDDHEAEEVDTLFQINQQQLEILTALREIVIAMQNSTPTSQETTA